MKNTYEVYTLNKDEIIKKWKSGLSKQMLSEIYKRQYNIEIKIIRSQLKHRHDGRFITSYEALAHVEKVILQYLRQNR